MRKSGKAQKALAKKVTIEMKVSGKELAEAIKKGKKDLSLIKTGTTFEEL